MAISVALGVQTADTGATPNTTGNFTPAVGEYLLGLVSVTASTEVAPTLVNSVGSVTWSLLTTQSFRTSLDTIYVFYPNELVSSATAQNATWSGTDGGTGSNIVILRLTGITTTGSSSIVQSAKNSAGAANTPTTTFAGGASAAGNAVITMVGNAATGTGSVTVPSGFTGNADIFHGSPDHGFIVASLATGHSNAAVTWGSTSATAHGIISLEMLADAGAAGQPTMSRYRGIPGIRQIAPRFGRGW